MARIAYVDGLFCPLNHPAIEIEDRGYQFSDGVYEVFLILQGRCLDEAGHFARLQRSLDALAIRYPVSRAVLRLKIDELLRRNRLRDALVYLQISRGIAPRNHAFPSENTRPVLVLTARPFSMKQSDRLAETGVGVITHDDIRWGRVDIKSISLLPNALAKQAAKKHGAFEAWLHRDGRITEGSSSNAWIVSPNGIVKTHPLGTAILGGITRETTVRAAQELDIEIEEQAFSLDDARNAAEAFLTSATSLVMPVVTIDGVSVGSGQPGPVTRRLRDRYKQLATKR